MLIFGYAQVSTWGQDLDSQIIALKKAGCEKMYTEKFTGTKMERKEFQLLLTELSEGDTLVVTKLDRFARSTIQGVETVQNLFERGIKVHILNMGIIENTPTGRLTFTIFSAFEEFERDMIVERTQEGKALAKLNPDFREGRPKKFTKDQLDLAMNLLKTDTTKNVSRKTEISEASLYRAIDSSGLTLDIWLRKKRDRQAAYSFFKRLRKQFGEPRFLVTDKAPSLNCALNRLKSEGVFTTTVYRMSKYLNNIIEQDHRPIKKRYKLYQFLRTASTTIKGIETIHALYKKSRKDGNLFGFSVIFEIKQLLGISA